MKSPKTTQMKDAGIVDNGNNAEDDREEGEIVDEYEMIISSEDEEFKLRARIKQLEDKSKDIERMEMLSANLANQYSEYNLIWSSSNTFLSHASVYECVYVYNRLCVCAFA